GIATMTHNLVNKVGEAGFKTRVASTRKTAPGLKYFDKKAVSIGDGDTHRLHLDDLVLIKDNHLKVVGGVTSVVEKVRRTVSFSKKVEIEVTSPKEALEAARAGADIILLDNLSPSEVRETTLLLTKEGVRNKVLLESSGRITGKNILEYAATGVDIVSVGQITHSAKALDLSLEIVKVINDD
ncbi:carboxylating nicotinate-nucleotide diphosphorylase, partial [Candidatus Bathyarchaeota archaeon]|nr:carboxylating nicotinate-nucleotide diphosphorylase [Candidatus Bathyarchaeota archaeon]